ncbi:CLUMA_CG001872, isoform A [Clunio marinus]|uniref:CLUMA_CG001872, isoform A n=1 Tax=Clunio marinus TaxID=568069 RepID=A0A1J1HJ85_9DIPT|nr:CLUMA_CG001872, isoform A [Clunio marinus]
MGFGQQFSSSIFFWGQAPDFTILFSKQLSESFVFSTEEFRILKTYSYTCLLNFSLFKQKTTETVSNSYKPDLTCRRLNEKWFTLNHIKFHSP